MGPFEEVEEGISIATASDVVMVEGPAPHACEGGQGEVVRR